MRGQESGSEHEPEETDGSAAPATPPPSFGQLPSRTDESVPQPYGEAGAFALPEPPPAAPSLFEPPTDDAQADTPFAGNRFPVNDPQGSSFALPPAEAAPVRPPIPVYPGPPPDLPDPESAQTGQAPSTSLSDLPSLPAFPGAQPWEVPNAEASPYDWFADPVDPASDPAQATPTEPAPTWPTPARQDPPTGSPTQQQASTGSAPAQSEPSWPTPTGHTDPATGSSPASPEPTWPSAASHTPAQPDATTGSNPASPEPAWPTPTSHTPAEPEPAWPSTTGHVSGQAESSWPTPAESAAWPNSAEADRAWAPAEGANSATGWPHQSADALDPDVTWQPPTQETGPWQSEPVVPGAPLWQPPPAFTAAAAGMPVWPAPVADAPAMPAWPAATGELSPDDPTPGDTTPQDQSGADDLTAALPLPNLPESLLSNPAHPDALDPTTAQTGAFDPATAQTGAFDPTAAQAGAFDPATAQTSAFDPAAAQTGAFDPATAQAGVIAEPSAIDPATAQTGAFDAAAVQPGGSESQETAGTVVERDQDGEQPFDPTMTVPVTRPAEPGDVPVWPPTSTPDEGEHTVEVPRDALPEKLPDLPFSSQVWTQKAALPPAPQPLALPPASVDVPTPPHGAPAAPQQFPTPQYPPPLYPSQPQQPPPKGPAKSKKALLATLGVLVLAGVATGGFFAYRSMNATPPAGAASKPSPSQPPATATPAPTEEATPVGTTVLNSEETDPRALSLTEAFPKKKIKIGGTVYTRVKADLAAGCEKAAAGPFADALRDQKCNRVLRATYVDSKRRYAVTTGIAVLPTKDAAMQADEAKNLGRNLWFRALPGAAGSGADRVHIAGGYAAGLIWGRYIVFSYATYADGHTPTAKEKGLGKVSGAFRDETSTVLQRRIAKS